MSSKGTTAYQGHHRPTLGTTGLHRHDQPVRDIIGLAVASLAYQGLPGVRRSCQRHRRPARLTLARIRCFTTFGRTGGWGLVRPSPLGVSKRSVVELSGKDQQIALAE